MLQVFSGLVCDAGVLLEEVAIPLGEILRMIREGRPAVTLAERTTGELDEIQKEGTQ